VTALKTNASIAMKNEKGFTLLETLVGMAILAVGLLGLLALQVVAMQGNTSGFLISNATALGEQRVEELKGLSSASPLLAAGNHADGTVTVQGTVYTRSYTIQDDSPVSGVSTITMTITWNDSASQTGRSTDIVTRLLKG
jgi:prepilin-type N-terminal cleavage/methylation domain-containing protein